MSKLKVNSIIPVSGVPTGGGGGIVQVKHTTKDDYFSTGSSSFTDVTGLSVAITPTSSSSKIFIMACVQYSSAGSGGSRVQWRILQSHAGGTTAVATGGAGVTFAGGLTGGFLGKAAVYFGAALILGGVNQLLFPMPDEQKFESEEDPKLSFNFSGVQNTSRAGTPVPIVYGEIITGSVVISAAIDTNQVQA